MNKIIFKSIFFLLVFIITPSQVYGNNALGLYMNDFYSKSNEASILLKEIETTLKDGSREKVCLKQRKAARLGLLANESLIKAFEIAEIPPPMETIKASQKRWESILNEC